MAGNNLSPRQKMIGMMYLVLTALLALNVSKEVLNAFQNVNGGIVRTTQNFNNKNEEVYSQFISAAETNPAKAGPWKDKAFNVKSKSDSIYSLIQKLKYEIVLSADKQVTFSGITEPVTTPYDELPNDYKNLLMVDLKKKSDRDKAGDIMINKGNGKIVQSSLIDFRDYLITLTEGTSISASLSKTFDFKDIQLKPGVSESWVNYNFSDMPLVAAITVLSKIQADVRNAESDAIKHLQKEIDAGSLKFTSAEAIQIAPSNYVFVGDSFKADVFLAAKDSTQNPVIYVGDYELDENGFYKMVGDYDSIPVKGGKGKFAVKTRTQGYQQWGGLIGMKTEEGIKMYPFNGEYQVAAQSFVVSPTKMNVLYLLGDMGNPIDVSVPGVSKDKIRVSCDNGIIKKVGGSWEVFPKKTGKAKITVSAEIQGKNRTMGFMEFRVKRVPKAEPKLIGSKNGKIKKNQILSKNCKMIAQLKDFDFDIKNTIVGFTLDGVYKGEIVTKKVLGNKLSDDMREFVKDLQIGSVIYISNITSKGPSGKKSNLGTIKVIIN
jgi:gliding motility-associated protein GldM